jgi:hypothetical protein
MVINLDFEQTLLTDVERKFFVPDRMQCVVDGLRLAEHHAVP